MNYREAGDPVRRVIFRQGRTLTWVAHEMGMSVNQLHRILLPAGHPDARAPRGDFYKRLSVLLGVPERELRPESELVA